MKKFRRPMSIEDLQRKERQKDRRNKRKFKEALQDVGVVCENSDQARFHERQLKKLSHG